MKATITSLHFYPLKSAQGIELEQARLGSKGFPLDRHWMLIDEENQRLISQRNFPRMALLSTALKNERMVVKFPGAENLSIPLEAPEANPFEAEMHRKGEDIQVIDDGGDAAQWFSDIFGKPIRLVRIAPGFNRHIPDRDTSNSEFVELSDGYPYLVTSNASLERFNRELHEQDPSAPLIEIERFRPNIVLNIEEPWVEMADGLILENEGGSIRFSLCKPCKRCGIPQINPSSGELDTGAVLHRVLKTLNEKHGSASDNLFGQNAVLKRGADESLKVGQALRLVPK